MSIDPELAHLQQEWHRETEPLPLLKRKIRRQNLRTVAGAVALAVAFAVALTLAVRQPSAFHSGLATGIAVAGVAMGAYVVRTSRGTWTPAAETTRAYADLTYRRALAQGRILRASTLLQWLAIALLLGTLVFSPHPFSARGLVITVLLVLELAVFMFQSRRVKQDIAAARQLLEQLQD